MIISILIDNPDSWMMNYVDDLIDSLRKLNHKVTLYYDYNKIKRGNVAFFLSCQHIVPDEVLERNDSNVVIHASDLPDGKGFSPSTWQILEGRNVITLSLFEAVSKPDAGDIYLKDKIKLDGTELVAEWRAKLGRKVNEMSIKYVNKFGTFKGETQKGKVSFYKKRTPKDSKLDINKSIRDQFNLLRVVDNEHYPAYFIHKGGRYLIKIYKEK